jgi:hypothetical protein
MTEFEDILANDDEENKPENQLDEDDDDRDMYIPVDYS